MRHHFGITSFGINTRTARDAGDRIINEHDEEGEDEELYFVQSGRARFECDGESMDAPAGTFAFARPGVKRTAFAEEPGTTILAVGGRPGEVYTRPAGTSGPRLAGSARTGVTTKRPTRVATLSRRRSAAALVAALVVAGRASHQRLRLGIVTGFDARLERGGAVAGKRRDHPAMMGDADPPVLGRAPGEAGRVHSV